MFWHKSSLNRLELVGEALLDTLNRLAQVAPTWLQARMPVTV